MPRKREPGETHEEYRQAMKNMDRNIKHRLAGRLLHNSTPGLNGGAVSFTPIQRRIWGWIADRLPARLIYVCFLKVAATQAQQGKTFSK